MKPETTRRLAALEKQEETAQPGFWSALMVEVAAGDSAPAQQCAIHAACAVRNTPFPPPFVVVVELR